MADFATFALRLADHRGDRSVIEAIFTKMIAEQATFTLEGDPLVELLGKMIADATIPKAPYSASELFSILTDIAKPSKIGFPWRNPKSLAHRISNVECQLRTVFRLKIEPDPHLKVKKYEFGPKGEPLEGSAGIGGNGRKEDSAESDDLFPFGGNAYDDCG
jgi:hypothetical protein